VPKPVDAISIRTSATRNAMRQLLDFNARPACSNHAGRAILSKWSGYFGEGRLALAGASAMNRGHERCPDFPTCA